MGLTPDFHSRSAQLSPAPHRSDSLIRTSLHLLTHEIEAVSRRTASRAVEGRRPRSPNNYAAYWAATFSPLGASGPALRRPYFSPASQGDMFRSPPTLVSPVRPGQAALQRSRAADFHLPPHRRQTASCRARPRQSHSASSRRGRASSQPWPGGGGVDPQVEREYAEACAELCAALLEIEELLPSHKPPKHYPTPQRKPPAASYLEQQRPSTSRDKPWPRLPVESVMERSASFPEGLGGEGWDDVRVERNGELRVRYRPAEWDCEGRLGRRRRWDQGEWRRDGPRLPQDIRPGLLSQMFPADERSRHLSPPAAPTNPASAMIRSLSDSLALQLLGQEAPPKPPLQDPSTGEMRPCLSWSDLTASLAQGLLKRLPPSRPSPRLHQARRTSQRVSFEDGRGRGLRQRRHSVESGTGTESSGSPYYGGAGGPGDAYAAGYGRTLGREERWGGGGGGGSGWDAEAAEEAATQRVFQAERRKRMEAEMEDLRSRRHGYLPTSTPGLPSQRYDQVASLSSTPSSSVQRPKSPAASALAALASTTSPAPAARPSSGDLRGVGKALYTFNAHNERELGFKKGDLIRIRRQVDGNWYEAEAGGRSGICPVSYVELAAVAEADQGLRYTAVSESTEGLARATFNFAARNPSELSLVKGQAVPLTKKVDDNWWEGRGPSGKLGIFPANYVAVEREPSSTSQASVQALEVGPPPAAASLADLVTGRRTPKGPGGGGGAGPAVSRSADHRLDVAAAQLSHTASSMADGPSAPLGADTYSALFAYAPANADELELRAGDVVYVVERCDDGWFIGTSLRTGLFGTFPGNYVQRSP